MNALTGKVRGKLGEKARSIEISEATNHEL